MQQSLGFSLIHTRFPLNLPGALTLLRKFACIISSSPFKVRILEGERVGRMVNGFHKCEDRISELSLGCWRQGSGRTQGSHWEEPHSAENTPLLAA